MEALNPEKDIWGAESPKFSLYSEKHTTLKGMFYDGSTQKSQNAL